MKRMLGFCVGTLMFGMVLAPIDAQQEQRSRPRNLERHTGLRVAERAPAFVLKSLDGTTETDLASLREKKPVVLIFGSYT
jgi:hypothetical protein